MKRFLRIAIIGAVVVAVVLGLYMRFRPTAADADTTVSTATAEIASLSASVNSAGNIQAHQSADSELRPERHGQEDQRRSGRPREGRRPAGRAGYRPI